MSVLEKDEYEEELVEQAKRDEKTRLDLQEKLYAEVGLMSETT